MPCKSADKHHQTAISERLVAAERACASQGLRFTPIRRKVLEILLIESAPMKAYDILPRLDATGAQKPPTVYRALGFLREAGLARRLESENAYVACTQIDEAASAETNEGGGFLICDVCGDAFEVPAKDLSAAVSAVALDRGFKLERTIVEGRGTCAACAEATH